MLKNTLKWVGALLLLAGVLIFFNSFSEMLGGEETKTAFFGMQQTVGSEWIPHLFYLVPGLLGLTLVGLTVRED
ncbi:MAG: hypothetical protein A2469_02115 [Candidatus Magasanikbacteria bacterium RIFOXYC2_FULL_40_16]|uniref:Uncharacterized protein n=1 Tax=Candidatus Magasanikbacteria bacterium RIFOXYC2_FULL_40_16 TaxID=1798703 RepID=A0A1F6P1C2_9BACT|nr:MAG: hypothetical protein A2224_01725 [Candidatus Magasanikbacteria bacterium RIFOXYA2_FULL_40_20]OGH86767.1 MAG: hypothetical protein A2301_01700 [Candidatus Magasanikbacteria bacterium RIFOXYB2_FULL_40_13]OGH89941.1 MAG: hypothetical protein A2469_02115 [Candidatus Magasanikbacteria bacterium RIFOXYC2_FULL_40_16]